MKHSGRLRILAAATATALTLVGCSSEPPVAVDEPVGATVDPARVAVTEPGENPVVLQYKDLGTEAQNVRVEYFSAFDQHVEDAAAVENTPELIAASGNDGGASTISSTLEAETAEPSNSDSERAITIKLGETSSDDLSQNEDLGTVTGFRLGWFANTNGQVSSVNFAAPTDATDGGRALVEQMYSAMLPTTVVFPTDPVGVGGSWTVDSRTSGASTMLQTITYTVTAIEGDVVNLDVSVAQRPSLGAIPFDDSGEQKSLQVLNSNTTSAGNLTVNLANPLPVEGDVHYTTRVVYGEQSSQTRVVQDSTTRVSYQS